MMVVPSAEGLVERLAGEGNCLDRPLLALRRVLRAIRKKAPAKSIGFLPEFGDDEEKFLLTG